MGKLVGEGKGRRGNMLLKADFFTEANLSSNNAFIIFLFNQSLKDFLFFCKSRSTVPLKSRIRFYRLIWKFCCWKKQSCSTHAHMLPLFSFLWFWETNTANTKQQKKEESFLVRLMCWISALKGQMSLRAAQESFFPRAGGGRCKPVRGVKDWCCLSFLAEMHPSKGENISEMFFCCLWSSFASTFPPVLLKPKAIFKLKQYHTRVILTVSAWLKSHFFSVLPVFMVHLHPVPLIQRADRVQYLCAKSVSWTLMSLISHLAFWLLLSVLTTGYTNWGTCARNTSTNSYCKVRVEAQR